MAIQEYIGSIHKIAKITTDPINHRFSCINNLNQVSSIHKIAKITTDPDTYLRKADELLKGLLMHEKTPIRFVSLDLLSLLLRSKELREIGLGLIDSLIVSTAEKVNAAFITSDEGILKKKDKLLVVAYTPKNLLKQFTAP